MKAAGAITISLAILAMGRSQAMPSPPAAEAGSCLLVEAQLTSIMARGEMRIAVGRIYPEDPFSIILRVVNDLDIAVDFLDVRSDCSCTVPQIPESPVAPGSDCFLRIHLHMTGRAEGHSIQTVECDVRPHGADDIETLLLLLEVELRRDLELVPRSVRALPSGRVDGSLTSQRVAVRISESLEAHPVGGVSIAPARPLPSGLRLVTSPDSPRGFSVEVSPEAVDSLSPELPLEILIELRDPMGSSIAQFQRILTLRLMGDLEFVFDPASLFLGILTTPDFPIQRTFRIRSTEDHTFTLAPASGEMDSVTWVAHPGDATGQASPNWVMQISLSDPGETGAHTIRLPLVATDLSSDRSQPVPMGIHFIRLPE